jgi:hypothetical protein
MQWFPTFLMLIGSLPALIMTPGARTPNAIQFIIGVISTIGTFIGIGFATKQVVLYAHELSVEHELIEFHAWDSFATLAMLLVAPAWTLPSRIESLIIAYYIARSDNDTITQRWEMTLIHEAHPQSLHKQHLCCMKCVQVFHIISLSLLSHRCSWLCLCSCHVLS